MVSWPGKVKPETSQDLAHAIDLFPTIAAATGLAAPDGLPGINLMDATARQKRDIVFGVCHATHNMSSENSDGTLQYLWCVEKRWKLLVRYHGADTTQYKALHVWDTAPVRLYDVRKDPNEEHDVAAAHPDVVKRLQAQIEAWHPVKR